MPMIPVDTAVQIMVGPLIDDTDFKARETGVAYNAAGMDVDLLKSSDTGTPTSTGLTLTTGGANDWVELSGGYYYVEVTAAQNDTEGKLKLIGIATGILPFESIEYDVVPVAVYNSLVKGTDNLQVDTVQVSGTSQTANDNGADINTLITNVPDIVSLANINAQVADVLKTDTVTEMSQGAPPLAPTMQQILNYLYREWVRNKVVVDTNTANQKQIFADDGSTILYEKDLTNASDVTTIAEATTGA